MPLTLQVTNERPDLGETVWFRVFSTTPLNLSLSCFYDTPPPPGFGPCPECRVQMLPSGAHSIPVQISRETWRNRQGFLQAIARNSTGEEQVVRISVNALYA